MQIFFGYKPDVLTFYVFCAGYPPDNYREDTRPAPNSLKAYVPIAIGSKARPAPWLSELRFAPHRAPQKM